MVIEISAELLAEMFRTDNYIRSIVLDGIPRGHELTDVRINTETNTIRLLLESPEDQSTEIKAVTFRDLRGED